MPWKARIAVALLAIAGATSAAHAAEPATPELVPLLDARLRYERVDQTALEADALTLRLRAGAEARFGRWSLLAEGEGNVAMVDEYNAFPFPLPDEAQSRLGHAVVADPENLELNRLQLQYRARAATVTLGRQRINLDDQRWVGSVGWRQNEQTFDALRGEAKVGPVAVDLAYSIRQNSIFGSDAGPRTGYDGDFLFAGIGSKLGPIDAKLFAYLLDYDEGFFLANSSQTWGGILSGTLPLGRQALKLRASHARQTDYGANPFDYAADYWSLGADTDFGGFAIAAGWERLGSDGGRAVQTPMATLHKFNGWADLFLTTPPAGLEDAYVSVSRRFEGVKALPGLAATIAFHQFDSAAGDVEYGTEWDASLGFRIGRVGLLAKFARYDAEAFGGDTDKFWLQAEWNY